MLLVQKINKNNLNLINNTVFFPTSTNSLTVLQVHCTWLYESGKEKIKNKFHPNLLSKCQSLRNS